MVHATDIDQTPPDYETQSPELFRYLYNNFNRIATILNTLEQSVQAVNGGIILRDTGPLSQPLNTTEQLLTTYDDTVLASTPGVIGDAANGAVTLEEGFDGFYLAYFNILADGANNINYTYRIYVDGAPIPLAVGGATSTQQALIAANAFFAGFVAGGVKLEVFAKVDNGTNVAHDVQICTLGVSRYATDLFGVLSGPQAAQFGF